MPRDHRRQVMVLTAVMTVRVLAMRSWLLLHLDLSSTTGSDRGVVDVVNNGTDTIDAAGA